MNVSTPLILRNRFDLARATYTRHKSLNFALLDQSVVSGGNFLTGVIVARALGIEGFGIFSLAWLAVLFMQSLQHALIGAPMLSIGPKQEAHQVRAYYSAILLQQIIVASLLALTIPALGFAAISLGYSNGLDSLILPLTLCIFFTQMHEFARRSCFARNMIVGAFVTDLVRNLSQFIVLLFLLFVLKGIASAAIVLYAIAACAALGVLAAAPAMPRFTRPGCEFGETTRRHFRFSKWLLGSAVLQWTSGNFYLIVAGIVLGPLAVGALKAAQTLFGVTHIFFQAAENILSPRAARIYKERGLAGLSPFIRKTALLGGALTGAACLAFAVPAKFWLLLLFGEEYVGYGFAVVGIAAGYFLMAMALPLRFACTAREETSPIFTGYLLATAFALVAAYPLIARFGLVGAVAGFAASHLIMLGNFWFHYERRMGGTV